MAKRKGDLDDENSKSKRLRLAQELKSVPRFQEIQSAKELQILLGSGASIEGQALLNVKTFQSFLASLSHNEDSKGQEAKRAALFEYLQSQLESQSEAESPSIPDLIKVWRRALGSSHENLFSSVANCLCLLLKAISSFHHFSPLGNALCKILLNADHIDLFDNGLSANQSRLHLISPCLRLLREIIAFDGGAAARYIYRARNITWQRLDTFLTLRTHSSEKYGRGRREEHIRQVAIDYLMLNISSQSQPAKLWILSQRRWVKALLQGLENDPPSVVSRVLAGFRTEIAQDNDVPVSDKIRFFDEWVLCRLGTLYSYNDKRDEGRENAGVQILVNSLLYSICASAQHSILIKAEQELNVLSNDHLEGLGKQGNGYYSDDQKGGPRYLSEVMHSMTALFQRLRPHADSRQADLLVASFRTSPSLLTEYFARPGHFDFEPSLSAYWVGYSRFLLALTQEPVREKDIDEYMTGKEYSSAHLLTSFMPPVISRKLMSKCLNQSSTLITFISSRILISAFTRLKAIKSYIQNYTRGPNQETPISHKGKLARLVEAFCEQCPKVQVVVARLRGCPRDQNMLHESLLRLIALYYATMPYIALDEEFDMSPTLLKAFSDNQLEDNAHRSDGMLELDLNHLIEIACRSPSTNWWHKPASTRLSVFTLLLRRCVQQRTIRHHEQISSSLRSVSEENFILSSAGRQPSFGILLLSLECLDGMALENEVYIYLDNCFQRLARKAIYYNDLLEQLLAETGSDMDIRDGGIDLLMIAATEQLPHLVKQNQGHVVDAVAEWFLPYVKLSLRAGADRKAVKKLCEEYTKLGARPGSPLIQQVFEPLDNALQGKFNALINNVDDSQSRPPLGAPEISSPPLSSFMALAPPQEDERHRGLVKWTHEDVGDAIKDNFVGELIMCLCSEHRDIRLQALSGLRSFMAKLQPRAYSEWQQVKILIGELIETANGIVREQKLSAFTGSLAGQLILVLDDPLHFLYEKGNSFLNRGPVWVPQNLPRYWQDTILLCPPSGDNTHTQEIEWLVNVLCAGLQSSEDMETYRYCNVFEHVLTIGSSPKLPTCCFDKILDLLFRCTFVGGSSTLITRYGVWHWLCTLLEGEDVTAAKRIKLEALRQRLHETSDLERIDVWSEGTLAGFEELSL